MIIEKNTNNTQLISDGDWARFDVTLSQHQSSMNTVWVFVTIFIKSFIFECILVREVVSVESWGFQGFNFLTSHSIFL